MADKLLAFITTLHEVDRVLVHLCAVPNDVLRGDKQPPSARTSDVPSGSVPLGSDSGASSGEAPGTGDVTSGGDASDSVGDAAGATAAHPSVHPFFRVLASLSVAMWHRWFDVERIELLLPVGSPVALATAQRRIAEVRRGRVRGPCNTAQSQSQDVTRVCCLLLACRLSFARCCYRLPVACPAACCRVYVACGLSWGLVARR